MSKSKFNHKLALSASIHITLFMLSAFALVGCVMWLLTEGHPVYAVTLLISAFASFIYYVAGKA